MNEMVKAMVSRRSTACCVAIMVAVMAPIAAWSHTPGGHRHKHHRAKTNKVTEKERAALLKSLQADKGKHRPHAHPHGSGQGHTHGPGSGPNHSRVPAPTTAQPTGSNFTAQTPTPAPQPAPVTSSAPLSLGGYAAQTPIQTMNPDISLLLDTAGAWFSVDNPQQAGAHDPSETGFVLQQLELNLESIVDPYFDMRTNLVFTAFGVEIEEAVASSLTLPYRLQMRAGQFLTRFGRFNSTHLHSWNFVDQPLVLGKMLGGDGLRGLGTEVSWLLPLNWYVEVIASSQRADGGCCARSFYGGDALPVRGPGDLLHSARVVQFFDIDRDISVTWGLSGAFGPNSSGVGNRTAIYGTDLYVRYRPITDPQRASLSWHSEALLRRRQVPSDVLVDWGVLSQLVWRYALRWETAVRAEHVTGMSDDPLDPQWNGARQRYTAQWTFYPTEFSRLRLQASADLPTWQQEPIYAVFLAMEVFVGTHGSHKF